MVIALDASAASAWTATSPLVWAHTVGAGANILLVVGVSLKNTTQPACSAVTYNTVSMTKVTSIQTNDGSTYLESSIWFLFAPASGAHNVSAAFTANSVAFGVSCSYSGAQQSNTKDASATKTWTGSAAQSATVTTVADKCWVFAMGIQRDGWGSPILTAGQTSRGGGNSVIDNYGESGRGEDSNAAKTPAGAYTVSMTSACDDGSSPGCFCAASFGPVVVVTASVGLVGQGLVGSYSPLSKGQLM
jgi:hypothetical protein